MGSSKKIFLVGTLESQKSYLSLKWKSDDFLGFFDIFDMMTKCEKYEF